MRRRSISRSLWVTAATVGMLLLIAGGVFGLGDRTTLVPAPEAVAESLLRQVATHRYRQTPQYVADEAKTTLNPDLLRSWFEPLERAIGAVHRVEGVEARIDGEKAEATARMTGQTATATCDLTLVRRRGVWLVTGLTAR